jgi:hypothetical protein
MRDRSAILDTLERQRAELAGRYRAFSDDVVVQPCTESETEGGGRWTPKDHLAHLLRVEEAFLAMAKRTVQGEVSAPVLGDGDRSSVLARVHRDNERHVAGLRERTVEDLLAELDAARAETLAFLATIDDEQLDLPIPGAPWADGTIGGVLMTNAHHERQHLAWVDEGLAATT